MALFEREGVGGVGFLDQISTSVVLRRFMAAVPGW